MLGLLLSLDVNYSHYVIHMHMHRIVGLALSLQTYDTVISNYSTYYYDTEYTKHVDLNNNIRSSTVVFNFLRIYI